jgi:putative transposase
VRPAQKRILVQFLQVGFRVSQRKACRAIGVWPSTCRYRSQARDQTPLRLRIRELAAARVRYGYRRLHILLQREGWRVNAKRIFRLYQLEGLSLRLKSRKKRVSAPRVVRSATRPNERWSMDFVADCLADGRRFRALTLVDNVSKVSPTIEAAFSFAGGRVVAVLERLAGTYGLPQAISVDNGPEFISRAMDAWAYRHGVRLEFSRPGKPTDNPFIESFNGHFRAECLGQHWFQSLEEARAIIEAWRVDYNTVRPHRALGQLTPEAFLATVGPPDGGGL